MRTPILPPEWMHSKRLPALVVGSFEVFRPDRMIGPCYFTEQAESTFVSEGRLLAALC